MSHWRKPEEPRVSREIPFIDDVCRFYFKGGQCRRGDTCSYFHSLPDHRRGWKTFPNPEHRRELEKKIAESKAKLVENAKLVAPLVMKDMEQWEEERLWPFTSYGPEGGKSLSEFKDKSYEEIRWEMMTDAHDGMATDILVNRYDSIIRTRRLFAGSLSSTENALMLTQNLPEVNEFDSSLGNLDFDDLIALTRDQKTEQMSLILFGTKTPPKFRFCKAGPVRRKNNVATYQDGGWKHSVTPKPKNRFNWTAPQIAPPSSSNLKKDQPGSSMAPMPPPATARFVPRDQPRFPLPGNRPFGPHDQRHLPRMPVNAQFMPLRVNAQFIPRGHHLTLHPPSGNTQFRPHGQEHFPISANHSILGQYPGQSVWQPHTPVSGPGSAEFEFNKENAGVPLAVSEMELLHLRNKAYEALAMEARERILQQNAPWNSPVEEDLHPEWETMSHDEYLDITRDHSKLVDVPRVASSDISRFRPIAHDLPPLPAPPVPGPSHVPVMRGVPTNSTMNSHEELSSLMNSLEVSQPASISDHPEDAPEVKRGNLLHSPDCIIS